MNELDRNHESDEAPLEQHGSRVYVTRYDPNWPPREINYPKTLLPLFADDHLSKKERKRHE